MSELEVLELLLAWQAEAARQDCPMSDWDHPANTALIEAILDRRDPLPALRRTMMARRDIGWTFADCIADLQSLIAVLPPSLSTNLDPFLAAAMAGRIHSDEAPIESGARDPLTGLPNASYLIERLREMYRPGTAFWTTDCALLVVTLEGGPDCFTTLTRQIRTAEILDSSVPDSLTVAAVDRNVFVALIRNRRAARTAVVTIPEALAWAGITARVWTERLPKRPEAAAELINSLCRRDRR